MGYRSNVAFAAKESVLNTCLSSLSVTDRVLVEDLLGHADDKEEDFFINEGANPDKNWLLYTWTDCKWYDEHFAINWIQNFVEENCEESCSFVRIGESDEDIETFGIGNDPFELGYSRRITYNC